MSAALPLLAPTTAANTAFPVGGFNATEYANFILCLSGGALAGVEVVNVYILDSGGTQRPLYNTFAATNYQLAVGAATSAVELPGGYVYQFSKSATVASVGVDVLVKPRAMTGA